MTEKERYKLVYKDEDAWEHEWDIEDTVNHIAIFQEGKMIVDELNKLNNENEQLKQLVNEAEDIIICQCTPYYQRIWENIKKNIKGDVDD